MKPLYNKEKRISPPSLIHPSIHPLLRVHTTVHVLGTTTLSRELVGTASGGEAETKPR